MVVIDEGVLEGLHLQGVDVDVDGQQIEGEVPDVHELVQVVPLEELLADDGAFGIETREVLLVALLSVELDQFFEGFEVLA